MIYKMAYYSYVFRVLRVICVTNKKVTVICTSFYESLFGFSFELNSVISTYLILFFFSSMLESLTLM